ncbi:autophagy protein 6, partial [Podochytrium sp. JEL0797]
MSVSHCHECGSELRMDTSTSGSFTRDSFIVLPAAASGGSVSLAHKASGRLAALASGEAAPSSLCLCAACGDELAVRLATKAAEAKRKKDAYDAFLASFPRDESRGALDSLPKDDPRSPKDASPDSLAEDAFAEHAKLVKDAANVAKMLADATKELADLDDLERQYWQDTNNLQTKIANIESDRDSFNFKHAVVVRQLERLENTNVYNDAFRIWHDGAFGTINGVLELSKQRVSLKRLEKQDSAWAVCQTNRFVEWHEINAALGQALLLVDILATKLGFVFQGYKLIPMGSFSRIEKTDADKAAYELYGSNDFSALLFWNRRFDNALVAFLSCIQQLGDFVQLRDAKLKLPYS